MTILYNFNISPLSDKTIEFEWRDSSTNLPMDISNYVATMYVKSEKESDIVIKTYSSLDSSIDMDYDNSLISIRIKPYDLQGYGPGNIWYELFLTQMDTSYTISFAHGFVTLLKYISPQSDIPLQGYIATTTTIQGILT